MSSGLTKALKARWQVRSTKAAATPVNNSFLMNFRVSGDELPNSCFRLEWRERRPENA